MKRRHLLVADTDPVNIDMIRLLTEETHTVLTASDLGEVLACLDREDGVVDAVLVDTALPDMERCRLIRKLKQNTRFTDIPVIALSSTPDDVEETAVLRYGASDYLRKPFCPEVFTRRLQNLLSPAYRTRLCYPQEVDPLTGVLTHEAFCVKAERLIRENPDIVYRIVCTRVQNLGTLRKHHRASKIDRFYQYLAQLLADKVCTGCGALGRIGDDCFAMCLPYHEPQIRANLTAARDELSFYPMEPEIQLRFGICTVFDAYLPIDELCGYAAKALDMQNDRHSFCASYDEVLQCEEERHFVEELESAIQNRSFALHVRPYFDLTDTRIRTAELICVWNHPRFGAHPAAETVSHMESIGIFLRLDALYLSLVCDFVSGCAFSRIPLPTLHLSLTVQTLMLPNCAAFLLDKLRPHGLKPTQFAIKISAHDYMLHHAYLEHTIEDLHAAGFSILLDKLGSVPAEQSTPHRFTPDMILLDTSLLHTADGFYARASILNASIHAAKQLQVPLLASDISNRDELAFLRSIGCMAGEGAYFTQPLSTEAFVQRLSEDAQADSAVRHTPLLTQPDIWDTASAFNVWFDGCAGAQLLVEVQKDTLLPLRANDSFFLRYCPDRTVFAACTQPLQSFLPPADRDVLLCACHEAQQTAQEQIVQFSMRDFGSKNDRLRPMRAAIKMIYRSALSFVILMAIDDLPTPPKRIKQPLQAPDAPGNAGEFETNLLAMCADA